MFVSNHLPFVSPPSPDAPVWYRMTDLQYLILEQVVRKHFKTRTEGSSRFLGLGNNLMHLFLRKHSTIRESSRLTPRGWNWRTTYMVGILRLVHIFVREHVGLVENYSFRIAVSSSACEGHCTQATAVRHVGIGCCVSSSIDDIIASGTAVSMHTLTWCIAPHVCV